MRCLKQLLMTQVQVSSAADFDELMQISDRSKRQPVYQPRLKMNDRQEPGIIHQTPVKTNDSHISNYGKHLIVKLTEQ
jgi:hypothetical protein